MANDPLNTIADLLVDAGVDTNLVLNVIGEARDYWGGQSVYIAKVNREIRDRLAIHLLNTGHSIAHVAMAMKCSTNTIRRLQKHHRRASAKG